MSLPRITSNPIKNKIKTETQALNYLQSLVREMTAARDACRIAVPGDLKLSVSMQKRAMWVFLTKQGQVMGALNALYGVGLVSDRAFNEFNNRAIKSLVPDVVEI